MFRVAILSGSLTLQTGRQPPLPIFPSSDTEFFAKAVNTLVRFEKAEKGSIVALTVSQDGNEIKAEKQT